MPEMRPIERKLTTVLAADAANYSGRMSVDEEGTVRALRGTRAVIDAAIANCGGRIANTSGDGLIADIPSVVGAVRCAIDIQRTINGRPDLLPFRLGIHLGDVIVEGQDLLGDGVNLAARLQEMAEVGGILVSQHVFDTARNNLGTVEMRPLGPTTPKHLADEIGVYAVIAEGVTAPHLLDNLGPKVGSADSFSIPDEDAFASVPAVADTPVRAKFKKDRNRILGALGAVVIVDITAGLPFLVTAIPEVALLYLLYTKWKAYKGATPPATPS
ncbi:adenylate/guanylate cyclase domain-containing protein [Tateyamaria omphalii]|uniref:adenylate/guanylate cyclase domain-containing protein n=1 Tax=Tateyamaria omphalii TaxID=299262 RepID=UPI001C993F2D|nr:adenylate/guanylate cyclase domain-containing protein [Tateyamaria omphalii]MBY5933849.1 adenylate/guanylate cyclase domain-containing protein [Tateyamaria omphalii]